MHFQRRSIACSTNIRRLVKAMRRYLVFHFSGVNDNLEMEILTWQLQKKKISFMIDDISYRLSQYLKQSDS